MNKTPSFLIWNVMFWSVFVGYCQSPGGVSGAQVWFKTSRLPNATFSWQDYAGDGVRLNKWNTTTEYSNVGRYFNFNPGLYFDGSSREFFLNRTNLSQGTIIGTFGHSVTNFNSENLLFGVKGRNNEGAILSNDKVLNSTERDASVLDYGSTVGEDLYRKQDNTEGSDAKYRERALKIVSYYQYQQPNSSVWGEDNQSSLTLGYGYLNTANGLSSYSLTNFSNNFYGYIPELLVYSRVLNPLERRKAETYLALKYGISLSDSYLNSDDELLWDWSSNAGYNTRITGIIRDDKSGLNQFRSTTSYEESDYHSDAYDSYQGQDPLGKPSRYRLLVISQSPGNDLKEKNATLWGDDNGVISTQALDGIAGMKRMTRKWKLNTNTIAPTTEQKTLFFTNTGLSVVSDFGKSTFTNSTVSSTGTSVTTVPLSGSNGYLEFKPETLGSVIIVKFGTQSGVASSSDYGIRIEPNGTLNTIENTVQPVSLGTLTANYSKITIEKKGNQVYINNYNPNGTKAVATKILTIKPLDLEKSFYGVVSLTKKTTDVSLSIKHGGFVATGSQVELSYDVNRAAEFANTTTKSFLIIDRSGTGNFSVDNVDYYPTDEQDASRTKIIFNNIIWDTDGNGKDVFTFGYRDTTVKLIAIEEAVTASCLNGVLQQDAKINIEIKEGVPGYKYTLCKTGNTSVLETGTFYESKKTISNLSSGDYDLTLEMIGTNFEKTVGATAIAAVATNTALVAGGNGTLEWTVVDFTSDKYIGFSSQKTNLTTNMLNYGVQIKQNQLFFWNKALAGNVLTTLTKGSKIKLERLGTTVVCSVNGIVIGSQTITTADIGLSYYGFIALEGSVNGIYNLEHTGFVTSPTKLVWGTASNLKQTEGDATTSKIIQKISILPTDCKPVEIVPPVVITDQLLVAPVPSKVGANFTIYVDLETPSEAMVLIFNPAGILVTQLRNANIEKKHRFVTSIPTAGVYIVKVLTAEGELSKSIIITQ
jgi:hypothetical protein